MICKTAVTHVNMSSHSGHIICCYLIKKISKDKNRLYDFHTEISTMYCKNKKVKNLLQYNLTQIMVHICTLVLFMYALCIIILI